MHKRAKSEFERVVRRLEAAHWHYEIVPAIMAQGGDLSDHQAISVSHNSGTTILFLVDSVLDDDRSDPNWVAMGTSTRAVKLSVLQELYEQP